MIRVTRFRFACSSGRAFSTSSSDAPSSSSSSLLSVDGVAGRVLGAAGGALRVSAHLGGAAAQLGGAATRAALRESSALLLAVAPEAKVAVPAPLLSSLAAARFLAELGSEAVQGVAAASALAARGVGSAAAQILRDSFGDSTGNAFPSASAQISGMVRDAEKLVDVLVNESVATAETGRAELGRVLSKALDEESAREVLLVLQAAHAATEAAARVKSGLAKDFVKDVKKGMLEKD